MTQISTDITTQQFLADLFGGPDAKIIFNTNCRSWKGSPQTYRQAQPTLQFRNEVEQADIYFIPNAGGTKNDDITTINSLFIDWDAGRDANKQYYSLDIVNQKKQVFLHNLSEFSMSPSYIIETRNGYHVYWLLYSGCTSSRFTFLQKALIHHFNSDPAIHNPNRVMRLPGYYACKAGQYEPFFVSIIEHNSIRYSHTDFSSLLPAVPEEPEISDKGTNKSGSWGLGTHNNPSSITSNTSTSSNSSSSIVGPKTLRTEKIVFSHIEKAIDYLKRQDLSEYLNIGNTKGRTHCPFHTDNNPSASIYQHQEYYMLKCHSSNCSFDCDTIIGVTQKLYGISRISAITKLMKQYNLQIDDTWREEYREKLTSNIELINNIDEWKSHYPELYNSIFRIKYDLIYKIEYAIKKTQLRSKDDTPVFYGSLREFERIAKKNQSLVKHNGQNIKVDRYCLLGLMKKIDISELSTTIQTSIEDKRTNGNHIGIYHIPEYTKGMLSHANSIARTLKQLGVRLKGISRPLIEDIFGKEKAKEVYPQANFEESNEENDSFCHSLEPILLKQITKQKYTTVKQLLQELIMDYDWLTVTDRRTKKYLPGLLIKHNLIEVQSNKILKEKYNLESVGYPKIIIRKAEETEE